MASTQLVVLTGTSTFFRYLMPLIPVLLLLTARIVYASLGPRSVRVAVIALLAVSNLLSVATAPWVADAPPFSSPFVRYLRSITTSYRDRGVAVIEFLKEHAQPGEILLSPDIEGPIIFYTDLPVIDARANPGLKMDDLPHWLFPKPATGVLPGPEFRPGVRLMRHYERIEFEVPASPRSGARPDPDLHEFFTSPEREVFVIYRRRP
jgi:hypothetical protein